MSTLAEQVRATEVTITADDITATLEDGRRISVPLEWFPRLASASPEVLQNYRWIGGGYGLHWPDVDEDLSIAGFLAGIRAPLLAHAVRLT